MDCAKMSATDPGPWRAIHVLRRGPPDRVALIVNVYLTMDDLEPIL